MSIYLETENGVLYQGDCKVVARKNPLYITSTAKRLR